MPGKSFLFIGTIPALLHVLQGGQPDLCGPQRILGA
jgi:hypothetical protein